MRTKDQKSGKYFLFTLDLLIEGDSSAAALEKLNSIIAAGDVADFRIQSGMQVGGLVEQALNHPDSKPLDASELSQPQPKASGQKAKADSQQTKQPAAKSKTGNSVLDEAAERIRSYMEDGRLIRLNVNKGRGIKLSVPCRILSFDDSKLMITVYHVDEKQVYTFQLNEIDDFI